jgi:hypothetical protein
VTLVGTQKGHASPIKVSQKEKTKPLHRQINMERRKHPAHAKQKLEQRPELVLIHTRERQSDKNKDDTSSFFSTNIQTALQVKKSGNNDGTSSFFSTNIQTALQVKKSEVIALSPSFNY